MMHKRTPPITSSFSYNEHLGSRGVLARFYQKQSPVCWGRIWERGPREQNREGRPTQGCSLQLGPPWTPPGDLLRSLMKRFPEPPAWLRGGKLVGTSLHLPFWVGEHASACGTVQNWSPFLSLGVQEGVPSRCPCQAGRSLVCPSCHREATGSPVAGPSVGSQRGPCERPGGCPAVSGTALQREPGRPPSPPPWLLRAWPTARAPAADRRRRHSPRD